MSISFSQLHFADPSLSARRLFWHVLSIGQVCRDEPERHAGLDKAGLFLFRVVSGAGDLEFKGSRYRLSPAGPVGLWTCGKPGPTCLAEESRCGRKASALAGQDWSIGLRKWVKIPSLHSHRAFSVRC